MSRPQYILLDGLNSIVWHREMDLGSLLPRIAVLEGLVDDPVELWIAQSAKVDANGPWARRVNLADVGEEDLSEVVQNVVTVAIVQTSVPDCMNNAETCIVIIQGTVLFILVYVPCSCLSSL